jgi:hypothetical protein
MRTTCNSRVHLVALTLLAANALSTSVQAQQTTIPTAMVVMTGTADVGGQFAGTFFLTRFEAQSATDGIAAIGSMHGVLNGRNIVTQVSVPITVTPGNGVQTTGLTVAAPASCDTAHIDFAPFAFRALGSVVTLDATGVDFVSSGTEPAVATGLSLTGPVSQNPAFGTTATFPTLFGSTSQPAARAPSTPVGSATPGLIAPAPQPTTAVTVPAQQLSALLCSISAQSQSASSRAQLVPLLNQVLLMLRQ